MQRASIGILIIFGMIVSATPAAAGTGPCKPENDGGSKSELICGFGRYAARAMANTISPSRRLALAWRIYTERNRAAELEDDKAGIYESVLVRLRDGAILWPLGAIYRDPGNTHGNNFFVVAAWSPNSRSMVATFDDPVASQIDVYILGRRDDALTGPIDLQPTITSAILAQMKDVQDTDACQASVSTARPMTIDNRGIVQGMMMMKGCATGLHGSYDVSVQVKDDPTSPDPSGLGAKVLSVVPSKEN
jgi:hypothetical protein